jgi:heme exporter protein A
MSPILELQNLRCERDERVLFEGLNCQIDKGDIVQVQGPNGSGKTTLLRIVLGLNGGFTGDIHFRGVPVAAQRLQFRQQLLYIGHLPAVNRSLTPLENLRWFDQLHGHKTDTGLLEALKAVGLRGFEDVPGHHLSAGQHRRVALARLYLSRASLWVLDEPFTAIDTQGVDKLRTLFATHVGQGGTILLTTHQDLGLERVSILNLDDFRPVLSREVA